MPWCCRKYVRAVPMLIAALICSVEGYAQAPNRRVPASQSTHSASPSDPATSNGASLELEGQSTQGGLLVGTVVPGTRVTVGTKRVRVSERGKFLVGFDRSAPPRAVVAAVPPRGPRQRRVLEVEQRQYITEEIDELPEDMVDLDPESRRNLVRHQNVLRRVRQKDTPEPHFESGFRWPVTGRISGHYGSERILNGQKRGIHWGVDIAVREGTPVHAPSDGVIVFAERDVPLSGHLIVMDHGHGLTSSFLHLNDILVQVGQAVRKGQVIGKVGSSGRTTGPHLDWRMNLFDAHIDPEKVAPPMR